MCSKAAPFFHEAAPQGKMRGFSCALKPRLSLPPGRAGAAVQGDGPRRRRRNHPGRVRGADSSLRHASGIVIHGTAAAPQGKAGLSCSESAPCCSKTQPRQQQHCKERQGFLALQQRLVFSKTQPRRPRNRKDDAAAVRCCGAACVPSAPKR